MGYLVTVATYRQTTGDQATDPVTVSALIEEAQEQLADALDRPLEHGTYTEMLYATRDGSLWPRVTPITEATGYTINGLGLTMAWLGVLSDPIVNGAGCGVSVTYSGGWIERSANPTAANRLPKCIETDLCWAVHALREEPSPLQVPAGARSVSLGDASIAFGPDGAPRPGDARLQWSRRTLGYRHRVIGGSA